DQVQVVNVQFGAEPEEVQSTTAEATAEGPPFSVSDEEVHRHYATTYDLALLSSTEVAGGLKGKGPAKENIWLLKRK
ncbi:hypothetical protein ACOSYY_12400, partial [Nitrospira sp. BLG_2]